MRKLVLGTLCAIQRTAAPSLGDACGIQSAADDVIADAGKVLDPAAADEHGRVFLKVVTFAGNVDRTFLLVGEPYPGDLTDSRVGLFGRGGRNRNADSALLRAVVQNGRLALVELLFPAVLDELVDSGPFFVPPCVTRLQAEPAACGIYL